jgi:cardiolipin synthase
VVLSCLSIINRFPIWAMMVLAVREILIISGGLYLVATGRRVIPASILGKITGWIFGVMVIVYIVNFHLLFTITLYAALTIMIFSFISYAQRFLVIIGGDDAVE